MTCTILKPAQIALTISLLLSAILPIAKAQSVTGEISGSVADPSGAVIPGVVVQLSSNLTQQMRTFTTDANGAFVFTNLVPGDYSLRIAQAGFRAYQQKAINVSSQERVDLHEIRLQMGNVDTTINVVAETAHVATDNADRSIQLDRTTIDNTPLLGRDYLQIVNSLPGVQATNSSDMRGVSSGGAPSGGINGGVSGVTRVTLDGVANEGMGNPTSFNVTTSPSVDAIAEVKMMVSNYSAEYGSRAGGQMNVLMKNGTNQFHGSMYYYWRHEELNSNEWFNNANRVTRPKYRFQNPGGTVGGPVIIPGTSFNRSRTKLFFFFSEDYLHHDLTGGVNYYTMPTALERAGDFSQTTTTTGTKISIKDPNTGVALPGNVIPASQISATGMAFLNMLPLPNTTDATGRRQYNAQFQFNRTQVVQDHVVRLDYNIRPGTTAFGRLILGHQRDDGPGSGVGSPGANWGQLSTGFDFKPTTGFVVTLIHVFRPNLINEMSYGFNYFKSFAKILDQQQYDKYLLPALKTADGQPITLPHFFSGNDLNIDPNINFSTTGAQSAGQAVTNPPSFGWDSRFPFSGIQTTNNFTDNITWIKGRHNVKVGLYLELAGKTASVYSTYNAAGTYWFGSDTANPLDTGYAYSNALVGTVQAYGEDNSKLINHAHYHQIEWFAQDSWKATRGLTLNLGVRFQIMQPMHSDGATLGFFNGADYNPSKSGQLLYPALVSGKKVSINPNTSATYAYARATSFDPASYAADGSPYSGINQYHSRYFYTRPPQVGPRVGFAYDLFGNGKTALRGGFGIFYGLQFGLDTLGSNGGTTGGPMATPPAFQTPLFYNTTISGLESTQGWLSPQNVITANRNLLVPTSYNWSLGIQHVFGRGLVLDVAYVANLAHHQFGETNTDANAIAPLTTWTPAGGVKGTANAKYLDPTSTGGTGAFYATNLIRAMNGYQGYANIWTFTSAGENNYNSLQTQLNRRFSRRLTFNSNWTWSRTLTYTRSQWIPDQLTKNVINRTHAVNVTFGYLLPNGSGIWRNTVTKGALDGWHLNGLAHFYSGSPMTVSCAASGAPIGWPNGTPTGGIPTRCQMTGDPWLPAGSKPTTETDGRLWYPLNATSFTLPPGTTLGLGNTPPTLTFGPGFENMDLSLSKTFKVKEGKTMEFRAEAFNALNHLNPSNPNTSLTESFSTNTNTNSNFGWSTSAQNTARHMAMSLRYRF